MSWSTRGARPLSCTSSARSDGRSSASRRRPRSQRLRRSRSLSDRSGAAGASTGLAVVGRCCWAVLGRAEGAATLRQAYLSDALNQMADDGAALVPIFIDGGWREIDTEEDLGRAHALVDGWD